MNTLPTANDATPAHLAGLDLDDPAGIEEGKRRAAAIECRIPGCAGRGHAWTEDPAEWLHYLEQIRAGRLEIDLYVDGDGALKVDAYLPALEAFPCADDGRRAPAEDGLLALAAELRSYAGILQQQAVNALQLHTASLRRAGLLP